MVIGPEGGFSPDEIGLFRRLGACFASLGTRILRSETAAVVAAGIFSARYFFSMCLGGGNGK
jgi:16S rRNA (uracil1498-N3)-methyltransferase